MWHKATDLPKENESVLLLVRLEIKVYDETIVKIQRGIGWYAHDMWNGTFMNDPFDKYVTKEVVMWCEFPELPEELKDFSGSII